MHFVTAAYSCSGDKICNNYCKEEPRLLILVEHSSRTVPYDDNIILVILFHVEAETGSSIYAS